MAVSMEQVKALRDKTGCGVMDCKQALTETGGDLDKAIELLRKKGIASAEKKSGRTTLEGIVESYIHMGGKLGVLLEINCETDFVARTEEFKELAHQLAMHVAAAAPQYLNREQVPAGYIEKERAIYKEAAMSEGKPEKVAEKIVEGKLEKRLQAVCLMDQPFVLDQDRRVEDVIKEKIGKIGENISVRRFARFALGEEI